MKANERKERIGIFCAELAEKISSFVFIMRNLWKYAEEI